MNTAMIVISTVTAPTSTGLATRAAVWRRRVTVRAGSRGADRRPSRRSSRRLGPRVRRRGPRAARAARRRVRSRDSRLVRAEPRVALPEHRALGGVPRRRVGEARALVQGQGEADHAPEVVAHVDAEGLPELEVPEVF